MKMPVVQFERTSGSCGDGVKWELTKAANSNDLTLTISYTGSGTGKMNDYTYPDDSRSVNSPWYAKRDNIKTLIINNGVTSIGNYAFYECTSFTGSLTIPNSVTSIGECAFCWCYGFTGTLTIPNSVTSIGTQAFCGCSGLTGALTIPNSVTSIERHAFYGCRSLTGYLTIPNSVTAIRQHAFYGCSGLTGKLTIGSSVTAIGYQAFVKCGFTSIFSLPITPPEITDNTFDEVSKTIPVSVHCKKVSTYKAATGWKDFTNYSGCFR
jgi:hypothetical protein